MDNGLNTTQKLMVAEALVEALNEELEEAKQTIVEITAERNQLLSQLLAIGRDDYDIAPEWIAKAIKRYSEVAGKECES